MKFFIGLAAVLSSAALTVPTLSDGGASRSVDSSQVAAFAASDKNA